METLILSIIIILVVLVVGYMLYRSSQSSKGGSQLKQTAPKSVTLFSKSTGAKVYKTVENAMTIFATIFAG